MFKKYRIIYRTYNCIYGPWIVQKRYWLFWWKDFRSFRHREQAKYYIHFITY